jgi:glycosyltransferase involved in cell wall biosynthesis
MNAPDVLSFCVITDGRRNLAPVLAAIFAQVQGAEVIVAGCPPARPDIVPVPLPDAASNGQLGALRNAAVARARGDWIAVLDDDIVLQAGFVAAFRTRQSPAPIVTARVLLPDGTRYWDHATVGGPRGHVLLDPDEDDAHLYMTGGGGWVMHRTVARAVRWDAVRGFYAHEDSDFAARCRSAGFAIAHEPRMVVLHDAPHYTSLGRVVLRRQRVPSAAWVAALRGDPPEMLLARAALLHEAGLAAEAADCMRAAVQWHSECDVVRAVLARAETAAGGTVVGGAWRV